MSDKNISTLQMLAGRAKKSYAIKTGWHGVSLDAIFIGLVILHNFDAKRDPNNPQ